MNLEQFFLSTLAVEATGVSQVSLSLLLSSESGRVSGHVDDSVIKLVSVLKMMHYHQCQLSTHVTVSDPSLPDGLVSTINRHVLAVYIRLEDLIQSGSVVLSPIQLKAVELGTELATLEKYPL